MKRIVKFNCNKRRVAVLVNHPNVVQIFSLGMDHGQFYW